MGPTPAQRTDGGTRLSNVNLSEREIDVLRCLIGGEPHKIISRRLLITEATVKIHIKAILRKAGLANRTQAAIWALHQGLEDAQSFTPSCANDGAPSAGFGMVA